MVLCAGDVDHVEAGHLRVPHQLEEGLVAPPVVDPREGLPGVLASRLVVLSQLLLVRRVEDEVEAVRVVLDLKKTQDLWSTMPPHKSCKALFKNDTPLFQSFPRTL